jgi:hypothetical protein
MKTLEEVAKKYKQTAAQAIYPGFPYGGYSKTRSSKAFKTGNLLSSFVSANADNKSIGRKIVNGFEFTLDIAPAQAPYGQYVHNGTYKMEARPFAEIAFDSPIFRKSLDEFLKEQLGDMVEMEFDKINTSLTKAGFTAT